ncbi:conserved hypothetical protein [Neospora caninum Liverpool]|uniref:Transmembrane protein n=1 Tax=Neospora caninum (strain Liverpool) TaxID=572307 RepID=F0VFZ7_NEOCL|nr:conserved hypothetical protein [Neospora caninum Liverpool]CBZ52641.1 conserved hypothetical protein [Neospora caninum Liverpool]CEL66618.1 TPA: hypothetical protein BN1204_024290 [Neospora caninum Liverpool]|eukprot:XP_003882673.1 conserved hypothetical protein [Neospora caninum Liverpool]
MAAPESNRQPVLASTAAHNHLAYLAASPPSSFSVVRCAQPRSASVSGTPNILPRIFADSEQAHAQPRRATVLPAVRTAVSAEGSPRPKWVISRASVSPLPPTIKASLEGSLDRSETSDVEARASLCDDGPDRLGIRSAVSPRKDTPNFLRFLCLLGGLMNAGISLLAAVDVMHFLIDPATYGLTVAQTCLGLIVVLREAGQFAQLSTLQKKLMDNCVFLDSPVYKGLFYMHLGLVSLALRSVASLYTVPGFFMVVTGFLCILIQKSVEDDTMKDNLEKVTAFFAATRH